MRNGWWKVRVEVTLDGASYDFNDLPQEAKREIAAQMRQGAVAGALEIGGQPEPKSKEDMSGVCPVCGGKLEYYGTERFEGGRGVRWWMCQVCESTGKEGFDEVFDGHHYEVRDASGNTVHGRKF